MDYKISSDNDKIERMKFLLFSARLIDLIFSIWDLSKNGS